ncbi:MAG: hypothetical protein JWN90_410 [Parcubacteria group bacterium]|nr:hypothetical protein [Parcubacteria group bacterium]
MANDGSWLDAMPVHERRQLRRIATHRRMSPKDTLAKAVELLVDWNRQQLRQADHGHTIKLADLVHVAE